MEFDSEYYAYFGLDHEATALEEIEKIEDNGDTLMLYTVLRSRQSFCEEGYAWD